MMRPLGHAPQMKCEFSCKFDRVWWASTFQRFFLTPLKKSSMSWTLTMLRPKKPLKCGSPQSWIPDGIFTPQAFLPRPKNDKNGHSVPRVIHVQIKKKSETKWKMQIQQFRLEKLLGSRASCSCLFCSWRLTAVFENWREHPCIVQNVSSEVTPGTESARVTFETPSRTTLVRTGKASTDGWTRSVRSVTPR